jgi:hypothetical protein
MTAKIHNLVFWAMKPRRQEDGHQSLARNFPAFRDNISVCFYANFPFPRMVNFYVEDGGSIFSKFGKFVCASN